MVKVDVIIISRRGGGSSIWRLLRSLLLPPAGNPGLGVGPQGEAWTDRCAAAWAGGRSTALWAAGGGRGRQGEGPLSSKGSRGKALERLPASPAWGPPNSDPIISPDLRGDQAG